MKPLYSARSSCRVCDSGLSLLASLGEMALTGVFPDPAGPEVPIAPLDLVRCSKCGLVQLAHDFDSQVLYGPSYGYRSGLNAGMVRHLEQKATALVKMLNLNSGDLVLDIGCNDGTFLNQFERSGLNCFGIDPLADKFGSYHSADWTVVSDFFTAERFKQISDRKANLITSISMFYDLEDPLKFAMDVAECLVDGGYWHLEQSYLPSMTRTNSYDTICHEHLEYYTLETIEYILASAGFEVYTVGLNDVNGGSIAVTARKVSIKTGSQAPEVSWLKSEESRLGFSKGEAFRGLQANFDNHSRRLRDLVHQLNDSGRLVAGYGASTKGNVLLQYGGFTTDNLSYIVEVNAEKFGKLTPGSRIPIVSESELLENQPDFCLVLPWHFRTGIVSRESEFLARGGKLMFPLPNIEIYSA